MLLCRLNITLKQLLIIGLLTNKEKSRNEKEILIEISYKIL